MKIKTGGSLVTQFKASGSLSRQAKRIQSGSPTRMSSEYDEKDSTGLMNIQWMVSSSIMFGVGPFVFTKPVE